MNRDQLTAEVEHLAFEFFFRFSRFEFALKENCYLEDEREGRQAKPGWSKFEKRFEEHYVLSDAGKHIIELSPQRQVVAAHRALKFVPESFNDNPSDLSKVTRLLKNVRNNLFHGGKQTPVGWDNPARISLLLAVGIELLEELAKLDFEADYTGRY
ncbi:hypothetical protein NHH73_02795 [Oxalobacteraceae bacterium OTU3CINTB1]|nr:hypothetical protein NHH73_02795 [Oxalobacteraceae bacterium OTU3CINTB1]